MAKDKTAAVPAAEEQPAPSAEEQRESLRNAQQAGETTSPQAKAAQERDAGEPSGEQPGDISPLSAEEQAARAAHHAEGGGAWPPDLLVERGTRPGVARAEADLYAEQAEQDEDLAEQRRVSSKD